MEEMIFRINSSIFDEALVEGDQVLLTDIWIYKPFALS